MKKTTLLFVALCATVFTYGQTVKIGETSYGSIAAAITASNNGDVILITGVHTESVSISKSITLRGTDPETDIIQASASASTGGGGSRVVYLGTGDYSVVIENLGIRYGNVTGPGGGIYADKTRTAVTLTNLIIEQNYATTTGGGINLAGVTTGTITNCTIKDNDSATDGGGLILAPNNSTGANSTYNISQTLIDSNTATDGGGMYINGNKSFGNDYLINVNIENTTISNNTASSGSGSAGGGGIWSKGAVWTSNDEGDGSSCNLTLKLVHATLYNNSHSGTTARNGIRFTNDGGDPNFSAFNSIIVTENTTGHKALDFANSNTTEVINCILGGLNSANTSFLDEASRNNERGKTATFAGLTGTLTSKGGSTQVLPITEGSNSDDYCTGATGITIPTIDQRGYVRSGTNDAGAYEYYDNTWTGTSGTDWATSGNWTDGVPGNDDILIPDVTNAPIIGASTNVSVNDITISETDGLTISSGGTLIVNGNSSGNVTYNRTLGTTNWYLMGSPVAGVTFNDTFVTNNSIDSGTDNNRGVATYTTSSDSWSYLQSGGSIASTAGVGYSVKRSTSGNVSFTGTINTASVTPSISTSGNGFNLLGNPYTSYVNSATFLTDNTGNLDSQTLWLWNQSTGNYEAKVTGDAFVLSPGQGFFVKATSGSTLSFAESNQASGTDNFQRTDRTEIQLLMSDGQSERFAKVYYVNGMTTGFDNGWDGEAFNGQSNALDVYTHLVSDSQGKNYQVQSLPDSNFDNMIIPVGVTSAAGTVSFSVDAMNIPSGYKVYLEDKNAGNFIRLDEPGTKYEVSFNSAVNGIGRFFLHMTTNALSNSSVNMDNISTYLTDRRNLRVVGIQQGTAQVRIFNILGKRVLSAAFEARGTNNVTLPNLPTGVYIVQLESSEGSINKKILIQ